jgi:site-specific recombinase XerD
MLRDLFPRDHRKYEESRYGADLELFASWLDLEGHLRHPLRLHLRRVKQALDRCEGIKSGPSFHEERLRQAFIVSKPDAYFYLCTGRIFIRFLTATNSLRRAEHVDALDMLQIQYQQYLRGVCGFANQTLKHHGSTVADFLLRGASPERGLSGLTAADVETYVQIKSKENTRQSLQHVIGHLRSFLRYCGTCGEVAAGLDVIDTVRVYRGELPPRALDWTVVRKLLVSIRRRDIRDWRDYAILHLMAYYGLRPSEVAALRLDSIDWEVGTLRVEQRKTHSILVLPLADRTLRLLRRYMKKGRPESELPQLFLRIRSPIAAMKNYGVCEVFYYRARHSGLPLDGTSSYALRHAFAMRLLRRGVGIKAIGDLLGHHSLEATCVYLRVDADMLRTVALPMPDISAVLGGHHE